jgi:mitochondrial fission protein ELM1
MNVYWFQDSKTGHLKQVQALLDQLKKEIELSITPINYSNHEGFSDMLANENQLDGPSILIGAGHDVYSKILQAKKYLKKILPRMYFQ